MSRSTSSQRKEERKTLEQDSCELQMTPMIDVTFLLLIFFMCTLKFKTLEGALGAHLPKDVGTSMAPAEPLEKAEIRLRVAQEGTKMRPDRSSELLPYTADDEAAGRRFQYGADRLVQYSVGPKAGLTRAEAFLAIAKLHQQAPDTDFTIDAGDRVIQDEVVQVMDHLLSVGIEGVTFKGRAGR